MSEIDGSLDGVNVNAASDGRLSIVYTGGYSTAFFQAIHSWVSEVHRGTGDFVAAPALAFGTSFVLAANASGGFSVAACDDSGLRVAQVVADPFGGGVASNAGTEVSVWPCDGRAWQVVGEADGTAMVLIETGGRLYLVKKR